MTLLLLEATSTSGATAIKADADTGTLYGVSLGTTTKSSTYSNLVLLELTQTRAFAICEVLPADVESPMMDMDAVSFSSAGPDEQLWYLRGML
tara:strand:+ start:257 stop:535 length:279 start_codon:yes stop_codon:yes gene_type:complete